MLASHLAEIVIAAVIAGAILLYYLLRPKKGTPVRKVPHGYFSRLWLWPPGSHARWEAELDVSVPGADKKVGFHSETTHETVASEGPTEAEVAFCRKWMNDLEGLFELTKPGITEAWNTWVKTEMPQRWQGVLALDGLSVPKDGDITQPWGVTWFCHPAGHFFSIDLRDGKASLASVDG